MILVEYLEIIKYRTGYTPSVYYIKIDIILKKNKIGRMGNGLKLRSKLTNGWFGASIILIRSRITIRLV